MSEQTVPARASSSPHFLAIGHSHIVCIAQAAATQRDARVTVVNLRELARQLDAGPFVSPSDLANALPEAGTVDALILLPGGNAHNILTLIEDEVPFWVATGRPPSTEGRQIIPRAVMKAHLMKAVLSQHEQCRAAIDCFPEARRYVLCPPPPVGDWDHVARHPGVFRETLERGPAPAEVRLSVYAILRECIAEVAATLDAIYVDLYDQASGADGFLAAEYLNPDPTHGNTDYGKMILSRMAKEVAA